MQFILCGMLIAKDGNAQISESINEIYVTIDAENSQLVDVIERIEQSTGFNFAYKYDYLEETFIIDEKIDNKSLADVLMGISKETNLKFRRVNNNIYVSRKALFEKPVAEVIDQTKAEVTVSGQVTDAKNEPLPGVTVLVEGTSIGTTTDVDGRYRINVDEDAVLVFSYVGFLRKVVQVNNQTVIDVTLTEDISELSEIVVVGYGTQDKRDVTAAISSVSEKEIAEIPVAGTNQALQGRVAGLDVVSDGGKPGQFSTVRIRGNRSFSGGNEPLYVVDGVPLTNAVFDINPQDIKSVEVLKDAAATAIYGSRGSNGVILITTKRGREDGTTVVSYDAYYGYTEARDKIDMMTGPEYAELKRESRRATGAYDDNDPNADAELFGPIELESLNSGRSTDWQDLVLSKGSQQSHQLSVSGGDSKTQYYVSGNFFEEKGIVETTDYTRYSLRLNLDHQATNWFKFGTSTFISRSIQNWGSDNVIGEALLNSPLGIPYEDNGDLRFRPTSDGLRTNPLFEIQEDNFIDERKFNRVLASLYAVVDLTNDLQFKTMFGPEYRQRRQGRFIGSYTKVNDSGPASAEIRNSETFSYTLENVLSYNKEFGAHGIGVTLLQSIQSYRNEGSNIRVRGIPFSEFSFYNIGSAEEVLDQGSDLAEWNLSSVMGRINYDFQGKYILQVSGRYDGSSRLSGDKWAFFPSISGGWRIGDESFMDAVGLISDLKLRVGYGTVGNTSISPYQTKGRLRPTVYAFGENPAFGFRFDEIPNEDLTWEKTTTLNIGLDYGIFSGRISGSFEYFNSITSDLLLMRNIPTTSGFGSVLQNIGSTNTRGVEITLNTTPVDLSNGFKWTLDVNWATYTEEILELSNGKEDDIGSRRFIGQPLSVIYDFEKIGIWQQNEESEAVSYNSNVGQIKVKDQNNDKVIDDEDRKIIGTSVPDWYGGITSRFSYKGFDLSVFAFARVGHTIESAFHRQFNTLFGRFNNLDVDYWTPNNPTNAYPRPNQNQENPAYGSTLRYFDGSYVKIRNITLGYALPASLLAPINLRSARIYLSTRNPLVFSRYDTFDPEDSGVVGSGEGGEVPSSRLYLLGINVSF